MKTTRLESLKQSMKLSDVQFPIYVLHTDEVEKQDGILWCEGAVVDDTNAPGTTIGQRRLSTPHKNLYDLRHMIDGFVALSKHRGKFFVDSTGKFFRYEKSTIAKLRYHKIKEVIEKDVATLIRVENIPFPFELKRPPQPTQKYAGVLYIKNKPSYLYELSEVKKKNTWRKV